VGNEVIPCTNGTCTGTLLADPVALSSTSGGVVLLGTGGVPVASGTLTRQTIVNIPAPSANLTQVTVITAGLKQPRGGASVDIVAFDPVRRVIYMADRTNNGITAINAATNTVLGVIPVPPCADYNAHGGVNGGPNLQCPSGVAVAPDLRKLVATDRIAN